MSSENKILSRDETKLAIQEKLIQEIKSKIGKSDTIAFISPDKRMPDNEILERYPKIYVSTVKFSKKGKTSVSVELETRINYSNDGLSFSIRHYIENWSSRAAIIVSEYLRKEDSDIVLKKIQFFLLPDNLRLSFKVPNLLLENLTLYDSCYHRIISTDEYLDEKTTIDDLDIQACEKFKKRNG